MTAAVIVAAVTAGLIGLTEQVVGFEAGQRLRFAGKAWRYWTLRAGLDAGFAVLVAFLAHAAAGAALNRWWHGITIALFSAAGIRTMGFELGDQAYGLYGRFDDFRKWVSQRITEMAHVQTSADIQTAREELSRLGAPVDWVAERLRGHVHVDPALDDAGRKRALGGIEAHAGDDGTAHDLKLEVLVQDARRIGGDRLVEDLVQRARDKPWEEAPPAP